MTQPFFSWPDINDAEELHDYTLSLFRKAQVSKDTLQFLTELFSYKDKRLETKLLGLKFDSPLGIAPGYDKNGQAVLTLAALGFGFVEVGTITPRPQYGNPKPRLFRLSEDRGMINRMGFNSVGASAVLRNLKKLKKRKVVMGINIGANKKSVDSGRAADDYIKGLRLFYKEADYITINISSPNTAKLRNLLGKEALDFLLKKIKETKDEVKIIKPIFIKLSPDMTPKEIDDVLELVFKYKMSGIITTNTWLSRPKSLLSRLKKETGGLSGIPLKKHATAMIRYIYKNTKGKIPIIGAGGVFTAADVIEKMKAGASLVQTYVGFVYEGISMAKKINVELASFAEKNKLKSIKEIIGKD